MKNEKIGIIRKLELEKDIYKNEIWEIILKNKGDGTVGGMWSRDDHACHARVGLRVRVLELGVR